MTEIDRETTELNLKITRQVVERLEALGIDDRELLGELSADLGDFYAEAMRCQRHIDQILKASVADRDLIGDLLVDLRVGLEHVTSHTSSAVEWLEGLPTAVYEAA